MISLLCCLLRWSFQPVLNKQHNSKASKECEAKQYDDQILLSIQKEIRGGRFCSWERLACVCEVLSQRCGGSVVERSQLLFSFFLIFAQKKEEEKSRRGRGQTKSFLSRCVTTKLKFVSTATACVRFTSHCFNSNAQQAPPFFLKQPNVTTLSVLLPFLLLLRCRIVMSAVMAALCCPSEYKYASVCLFKHLLRPCSPEKAFSRGLMRFPCSRAAVCRKAWSEGVWKNVGQWMEMDSGGWGSPSFLYFYFFFQSFAGFCQSHLF